MSGVAFIPPSSSPPDVTAIPQLRNQATAGTSSGPPDVADPPPGACSSRYSGGWKVVNVNLTDVSVQVPVALAANVCDLNVAVLVDELTDGTAPCTASADPSSVVTIQDGGPVRQRGLVNVNVTDLVVQVPIGIAAKIGRAHV